MNIFKFVDFRDPIAKDIVSNSSKYKIHTTQNAWWWLGISKVNKLNLFLLSYKDKVFMPIFYQKIFNIARYGSPLQGSFTSIIDLQKINNKILLDVEEARDFVNLLDY